MKNSKKISQKAVQVRTENFEASHGSKPRGRGFWFFEGPNGETFSTTNTFAEAKKEAVKWAARSMMPVVVKSTRVERYVRKVTMAGKSKHVHIISIPKEIAQLLGVYDNPWLYLEWSTQVNEKGKRYLAVTSGPRRQARGNRSQVYWSTTRSDPQGGSRKTAIPAAMAADLRFADARHGLWEIEDGEVRLYAYYGEHNRRVKGRGY